MFKKFKKSKGGFSLVELIVTVTIVAILIAILAPSLIGYIEDSCAKKDNLEETKLSIDNAIVNVGMNATKDELQVGNVPLTNVTIDSTETLYDKNIQTVGETIALDSEPYKNLNYTVFVESDEEITSVHVYDRWDGTESFESVGLDGDGDNGNDDDSENTVAGDEPETQTQKEPLTTLAVKTWDGLTSFNRAFIWTDGTNIYYSYQSKQYVLNGKTWEPKSWNKLTSFYGNVVWVDDTSIYYSNNSSKQYVLNSDTWEEKDWNGLTSFSSNNIWTDGTNIYCSYKGNNYVLNSNIWEIKTWNGLINFDGGCVWTDGTNIYCSDADYAIQYVLNDNTWVAKTWNIEIAHGNYIWTDGINIYYSKGSDQYVLNGDTWEPKTWNGLTSFDGKYVWTDGTNYYYSNGTEQYIFS